MATPRKTAAQKAAEAAEREAETTYPHTEEPTVVEAPADPNLSAVKDDKTGKRLTLQQLKNRLRNEAEREVLDNHRDEVIQRTQAKYDEHGLEYVRRLTEEEKAAKQIEEIYAQYPHLRPKVEAPVESKYPAGAYQGRDAGRVEAVPGGALDQFRTGNYDEPYIVDGGAPAAEYFEDPEAREGE